MLDSLQMPLTSGKITVEKTSHVNQAFCSVSWSCCDVSLAEATWPSEIHETNVLQVMKDFLVNFLRENSWGFSCPWLSSWAVTPFIGIKCPDLFYFSRFFPRFGWQRVEKIIRFLDNSNATCCVSHTSWWLIRDKWTQFLARRGCVYLDGTNT